MWAAPGSACRIDALEVAVQADYDVRGELGVSDDVPHGYGEVRHIVRVESTAPGPAGRSSAGGFRRELGYVGISRAG